MINERARNIESAVLRALAEQGQVKTAADAGLTTTRLSRWKNADDNGGGLHLPVVAQVLASLGLTVVDVRAGETVTIPREEYDALRTLARVAVSTPQGDRSD